MCPYRKYLVNILRTLCIGKESSKWIMCGLVILPFQGFVDLLTFPCIFFLPCGVLGAVGDERVLWGGGSKKLFQGSLPWQIPTECSWNTCIVKRTI